MGKDKEEIIVKESIIRGEGVRDCPFGLPIPEACKNAGGAINRMAPIEGKDTAKDLEKANRLVYAYQKECRNCKYADKILKEYNKVDCDFGDTAAGKRTPALKGSPLYPQTFGGIGLDGLYGFPLGLYSDNSQSRNLFFGLFSLLGGKTIDEMIKLADQYDKCGEEEKADLLDNMLKKLQKIKDEYRDTFVKIEKHLYEYRRQFEDKRHDSGLLWGISDDWFGSRQVNK